MTDASAAQLSWPTDRFADMSPGIWQRRWEEHWKALTGIAWPIYEEHVVRRGRDVAPT